MLSFIFLGLYSLKKVPIDRLPNIEFPIVSVNTTYKGADAYVVDVNVTQKIENALSNISGVEYITSQSYAGTSNVTVVFSLDKDIEVAAQEVRDAVQRAYRSMPIGVDAPIVRKVDTSGAPIMAILLHSKTADYQTIAYYADKLIKRDFEKVNGVGGISLAGFRDNVLWVRIDSDKLYSYGLTPMDVAEAVGKNHLEAPAGIIYGKDREYIIRLIGKVRDPKELENTYIHNGIKIGDVAKVYFGEDEKRGMSRFMGEQAVALIVYKQATANTIQVVDEIKRRIEYWNEILPQGMRLDVTLDTSIFIKDSVKAAQEEIIIGSLLTALVVYFFLGSLRLTFVPVFAIPVALLGTVFFIYITGSSLNTMTLLAMAVAVGIVIDDAIVVLESIYRRREEGLPPLEAGETGTKIVIFALLASTASLIIVFFPVIFLRGVLGSLLGAFALTLIIAIAISYVVAISFTPMAVSRLVEKTHKNPFMKFYEKFESLFDRALTFALNHKKLVIFVSFVSLVIGFQLFKITKKEFFPIIDEGRFLVRFETPTGSSFEFTEEKAKQIEEIIRKNPYVDRFGMALGQGVAGRADVNGGLSFVYLKSGNRPHQAQIMDMLRKEFAKLRDVRVSVEGAPIVFGAGRQVDLQYVIKGPDINQLQQISDNLVSYLKSSGGYRDINTDLRLNEPQIKVEIDRAKLGDLGISVEQVANTLQILFGKFKVATYELGSESYDVYVKADENFVKNWENLNKIYVRSSAGKLVPLTDIVDYEITQGYKVINRYNRQYSFTLFANLSGKDLATAISEIEDWLSKNSPPGYTFEKSGQAREFAKAFQGFGFAIIVALVGVYMVLASLFESFRHPFTVLLMVPLAVAGTFGLLYFSGTSLSVPTYFGIILLIGIIVRDAVLFIERIIQLRKEGWETRPAIMQARKERLRPILMTTLTIISALIPVALGLTAGSEFRKPLAIAVIGGILTGLPLSLFLLPVVYELLDSIKFRKLKRT